MGTTRNQFLGWCPQRDFSRDSPPLSTKVGAQTVRTTSWETPTPPDNSPTSFRKASEISRFQPSLTNVMRSSSFSSSSELASVWGKCQWHKAHRGISRELNQHTHYAKELQTAAPHEKCRQPNALRIKENNVHKRTMKGIKQELKFVRTRHQYILLPWHCSRQTQQTSGGGAFREEHPPRTPLRCRSLRVLCQTRLCPPDMCFVFIATSFARSSRPAQHSCTSQRVRAWRGTTPTTAESCPAKLPHSFLWACNGEMCWP